MAISKQWAAKPGIQYSAKIAEINNDDVANVFFANSVNISNCYIKVETIMASKSEASIFVSVKKNGDELEKLQYFFTVDLNGKNFIAQAYEHLKTLPEFAGAVDC